MQQPTRLGVIGLVITSLLPAGALAAGAAQPIPIVNPGFEDVSGQAPFNEFTFGPPNGWALYDPEGVTQGGAGPIYYVGTLTPFEADPVGHPGVYVNFPDGAPEGQRVAIAFNFVGSGGDGAYGVQQTLVDTLQPNTCYTLTVEVGNIASGTAMSGEFFDLDGFPGYRVELLAGGGLLDADDNELFGLIPEGEFATSTVTFTTGSAVEPGQQLGIRLVNLNEVDPADPGANLEVDFDDVRLVAEPIGAPGTPGDLDGDGDVDSQDLNLLLGDFGCVDPDVGCIGDADGDGDADSADLNVLLANFGPPAP